MASLFQFSIRSLLVAVAFVSLSIAALLNANGIWNGVMWGLVLYLLTAAALLVAYRSGARRAFWLGFLAFGGLYLLLYVTPTLSFQTWARADPLRSEELLATHLAQWAYGHLLPESRRSPQIPDPNAGPPTGGFPSSYAYDSTGQPVLPGSMSNPNYVPIQTFTQIAHALALIAIAMLGGKTSEWIYRTRPGGGQ